ncbi:hypothetical protein BCD67_07265 [Oscillatoriales cyanobacterium USR001]|nr:hypothetical protein BCD67_07265 [Oscillatoriales cyanobacterium USR001]
MTNSQILPKLIASCLCFSLLSSLAAQANPLPTAPAIAQAETSAPANNIDQKLLGKWESKDPDGNSLSFIFAPEGKLYLVLQPSQGIAHAKELRYKVDAKNQPIHLDVGLSNTQTVMTVFEITAEGQMRLQLEGTKPGDPRPSALSAKATVFNKVSDAAALPENTQLVPF